MGDISERANERTILDSRWTHIHLYQIPDIDKMDALTMRIFDMMVDRAKTLMGWEHHINSTYRDGDTGQHGKGKAIDFYFYKKINGDVLLIHQLLFTLQYGWTGVGFYPHWNTPGLHVDTRDEDEWKRRRAIWYRNKSGIYIAGHSVPHGII